jgi:uncharacterized protein YdeI (YjbR/CyaY-like superfamily)
MKTLLLRSVEQWREWLAKHHASEPEVWLIFHKKQSGIAWIDYKEALDEALCFGWIDSLVKRLDDSRYARKFTPRRPDSRWSALNRRRYAELRAEGRLAPAGIACAPSGVAPAPKPSRLNLPEKLPSYLQRALHSHPAAMRTFNALSLEERRRYYAWIESAKREKTKLRRLEEAIRLLTAGKVLGLK